MRVDSPFQKTPGGEPRRFAISIGCYPGQDWERAAACMLAMKDVGRATEGRFLVMRTVVRRRALKVELVLPTQDPIGGGLLLSEPAISSYFEDARRAFEHAVRERTGRGKARAKFLGEVLSPIQKVEVRLQHDDPSAVARRTREILEVVRPMKPGA